MINLKRVADSRTGSEDGEASTLRFAIRSDVLGNIGEPLDHSGTKDNDPEETVESLELSDLDSFRGVYSAYPDWSRLNSACLPDAGARSNRFENTRYRQLFAFS